jgi:hypothetical protein
MREESHFMRESKQNVMRESKQKCGNFTVIAGNLEGLLNVALYNQTVNPFSDYTVKRQTTARLLYWLQ